jgi:hypothetical protein
MKKLTGVLFMVLCIVGYSSAQFGMGAVPAKSKVKIKSGDPSAVKGKTMKVEFIYDGMSVGKFDKEEDYIAKKKAEYNEKEPGKGDKWALAWKGDRAKRFEPSFIEKFNELGAATSTKVTKDGKADLKLVLTTTFTEPGFNIGVMKEPSRIDVICDFQDMTGKSVLMVNVDNVPGQTFGGGDFDTGVRLSESYEKLGKDLYKNIAKKF